MHLLTFDVCSCFGGCSFDKLSKPPTMNVELSTLMNMHEHKPHILIFGGYSLCWVALEAIPNGFDFAFEILNGGNYLLQPCSAKYDAC